MSADWIREWLRVSAAGISARSEWLTDLDAAIGDGDHGINLDRGFRRVLETLDRPETASLEAGDLVAAAGRSIMGTVGGASGALYGRALLRAGGAVSQAASVSSGDRPEATMAAPLALVSAAFDVAVDAIASLGRSQPGDKTMLDALVPAAESIRESLGRSAALQDALRRAADAAEEGLEATRPLVARRGRASYLGERSAGHLDPGAASCALLIRALAETARGRDGRYGRTRGGGD